MGLNALILCPFTKTPLDSHRPFTPNWGMSKFIIFHLFSMFKIFLFILLSCLFSKVQFFISDTNFEFTRVDDILNARKLPFVSRNEV